MKRNIYLDERNLEEAEIIGNKRFHENQKRQLTMSWDLKKMKNSDRDILGAQGEIAFNQWCIENDILYNSDHLNTQCRNSLQDLGDGIIFINRQPYSVEIKTTQAKDPHLIIPEYQFKNPKDIYVLIKKISSSHFKLMGFMTTEMLSDFYDDSLEHTCNTCYRAHHQHLVNDWDDFITLFDATI